MRVILLNIRSLPLSTVIIRSRFINRNLAQSSCIQMCVKKPSPLVVATNRIKASFTPEVRGVIELGILL